MAPKKWETGELRHNQTKQNITQKEKVEHWEYNKHILTKHTNWKNWGNKKKVKNNKQTKNQIECI